MARIRSIKPEFWTSEQIVECSANARLLFIGLWNFCDDAGRHPASTKRLKMEVFPADPFDDEQIKSWILELISSGLIESYVVDGEGFWQVTGWHHQKIDQPTFKHPAPDGKVPCSPNKRRTFAECSLSEGSGTGAEPERSGAEWKGTGRAGVFSKLTAEHLKDTACMVSWHKHASSQAKPVIGSSEADLLFVLTACEKSLEKGDNPPALFASLISQNKRSHVFQAHEDRAKKRLRDYQRTTGPPGTLSADVLSTDALKPPKP